MKAKNLLLVALLTGAILGGQVNAQYFGRNKPRYEKFDFKVLQTPHFEIYHYLDNPELLAKLANESEHWYKIHQSVLLDTFDVKNPIIFYNNHADFQQTNAVSGAIGMGTGGVTEGLKNRVILPMTMSNQQTHHVLGHELVHAFQYHLISKDDSISLRSMANLPLWMVEGLAEYMSIGRVDANTAMWMRDATLQDDVPRIKDLDNPKYFPYRYGQAFWAFVTGLKGDQIIKPLFMSTAKYGLEEAVKKELNMNLKDLSKLWQSAIKNYYASFLGNKKERFIGKKLISKKNAGRMNISPVLSPNGRYVIFLSEKDLFSLDLFLADARDGKIIRKVASATKNGHLDDIDFVESAGTWSPDSKKFAFVAVRRGENVLVVKDVFSGKTIEEFIIPGIPAFSNPAWSPDGKSIVFTGLVKGQPDLYQFFLKTKKVRQLTDDPYSELHPNWSADGSKIVLATDRLSMDRGMVNGKWTFNLAIFNMETQTIENLEVFYGADNLNPVFDIDGNILFLSDRDGFRNMYKYEVSSGKVFQLTDFLTGVSGITQYAPAITTSTRAKRNRVLFMHYFKNGYNIYRAKPEDFLRREVSPDSINRTAATLLKVNKLAPDLVKTNLETMENLPAVSSTDLRTIPYKPKFKLDYVGGGAGVGVGTNQGFGTTTRLAGGIDLLFGDILGNNQLSTSIMLNGEILDFGGSVAYINQKNRIGWGLSLSHIPYRSGLFGSRFDSLKLSEDKVIPVLDNQTLDIRQFENRLNVFAQYPFSKILRLEGGASFASYSNRVDQIDEYFDLSTGLPLLREKKKVSPDAIGLNLFNGQLTSLNIALVGDNSYFGIASPLKGYRFRLGIERTFGSFDFYTLTADYRKYFRVKPITFAFRAMHSGRYGKDANSSGLFTNYLGYPWYVRGYEFGQINSRLFERLQGSKIMVSNFEIRLPFTGPERLSVLKSKFFFTELALFADAGLAWNNFDEFKVTNENGSTSYDVNPVFSVGASLRINFFGAMILEPYYAFPLSNDLNKGGVFGLNIVPGW